MTQVQLVKTRFFGTLGFSNYLVGRISSKKLSDLRDPFTAFLEHGVLVTALSTVVAT
jgi:hypothetical protein